MQRITGILLIVISAASFGTLAIFGRILYADGLDTYTMLFLRFSLAALFMIIVLLARGETLPRGKTLLQLIGMGALGYVGQSFSFLSAIKYASAGLVALLLYLYPIFVFILSVIFLRERVTRTKIVALLLALIGTALTVDPAGGQLPGILLAIASALIYSVYIIVGTGVMKHVTVIQSSSLIFASAAMIYGILIAVHGAHFPATRSGWLGVAGIVLIATVIPVATFLAGLERIGPTRAAMLSTLEPVVTVLLAGMLFAEQLGPMTILGGALILAAVTLLTGNEATATSRRNEQIRGV